MCQSISKRGGTEVLSARVLLHWSFIFHDEYWLADLIMLSSLGFRLALIFHKKCVLNRSGSVVVAPKACCAKPVDSLDTECNMGPGRGLASSGRLGAAGVYKLLRGNRTQGGREQGVLRCILFEIRLPWQCISYK